MALLFEIETDQMLLRWEGPAEPRRSISFSNCPGCLKVMSRRRGSIPEVRPADLPAFKLGSTGIEEGPRLYEECTYHVSIHPVEQARVEVRHRDPTVLRSLSIGPRGDLVGTVHFGSQVGRSQFSIVIDGDHELDFEVEVFPSKIDYKTDYDQMLAEVTDFLMGLALEYLKATYRPGESIQSPEPTQVEWLTLLRRVWGDLERALVRIAEQPRRRLVRERRQNRVERIRRVDNAVRRSLRRGEGRGGRLRLGDVGVVREYVHEQRPVETLDTPEHRWLRAQLVDIRGKIAQLVRDVRTSNEHAERRSSARQNAVLNELEAMEAHVNRLLRLEPLAQATSGSSPNFSSLLLQSAAGYREAYTACLILRLGLHLEGGPVEVALKDIAALYEYWCYLSLLKLLSEEMRMEIDPAPLFKVTGNGLRVDLKRGHANKVLLKRRSRSGSASTEDAQSVHLERVSLAYNPSCPSATGVHRPDVGLALQVEGWHTPFEIIFDAKYRLDASPAYIARLGSPGPPEDAVNVLHRYRDAILASPLDMQAGSSYQERTLKQRRLVVGGALFPYQDGDGSFRHNRFWESLSSVGIGAMPFLPSQQEYVREWLRTFLHQSGWLMADRVIDHRAASERAKWTKEASEPALMAVLRPGVRHLEWVREHQLYYAPLEALGPRRFVAKWIAFYQGRRDRGANSGLTHEAAIVDVEVKPRKDIPTPWTARSPNQLQIVYRLGAIKERARPIEIEGGMRWFRWGSRLSLNRAQKGEELYIETEPEWRLYDELRARGHHTALTCDNPRVVDPNDVKGRATFHVDSFRIRYHGAAGFRIEGIGGVDFVPTVSDVIRIVEQNRLSKHDCL